MIRISRDASLYSTYTMEEFLNLLKTVVIKPLRADS